MRKPLVSPDAFYRNYVEMQDDPKSLDRMTLMLTGIYKFARHEWVGIKGVWDAVPDMATSHTIEEKLAEFIWQKSFVMCVCLMKCFVPVGWIRLNGYFLIVEQ